MTHQTASTSIAHFRNYDAAGWYHCILSLMREEPERDFCIADMARLLDAEKSTLSARLNELHRYGDIEYTTTKPSHTTGVKSKHFRIKMQPTMF